MELLKKCILLEVKQISNTQNDLLLGKFQRQASLMLLRLIYSSEIYPFK